MVLISIYLIFKLKNGKIANKTQNITGFTTIVKA